MSAPTSDRSGIRQTVRALIAAGWLPLWVDYNDGDVEKVTRETETVDAIMAVDDAFLVVEKGTERGWVRFVMGNDPDEVVCDYTIKLEDALAPMFERWNG
jgi:hypothetical protein